MGRKHDIYLSQYSFLSMISCGLITFNAITSFPYLQDSYYAKHFKFICLELDVLRVSQ